MKNFRNDPPSASRGSASSALPRLGFIDQARGYAIFGMILVNFLGHFDVMPWILKHHREGLSYADHIAPVFIFIVGMGFHLSFMKTTASCGLRRARIRAAKRYAILIGIGLIYGGFDLSVAVWDALMDIGVSGMLALPFMMRSVTVRAAVACVYLGAYQFFFSCAGYGAWVMANSINGGPLGPLSWSFLLLAGTIAYDMTNPLQPWRTLLRYLSAASCLCAMGWILRAEWLGVKAFWPFTQYGMSAPYPVFACGLSFLTIACFFLLRERAGIRLPHLDTLGKNPLVLYLLQAVAIVVMHAALSSDLSATAALLSFAALYALCYGTARQLEKAGRFIKV